MDKLILPLSVKQFRARPNVVKFGEDYYVVKNIALN